MKNPLVSVIIPTHNRVDLLPRAIRSVLNQTYKNIEIIIVDDSDSDDWRIKNTKVIESLTTNEVNLKYMTTSGKEGGAAARNLGIREAKGEFIAFLDDDDEFSPRRIEKTLYPFFNLPSDYGVVYCMYTKETEGKFKIYPTKRHLRHKLSGDLRKIIIEGNFITTSSVTIRKNFLEAVGGFDINLPRHQDWELFIRLSNVCKFHFIPEVLFIQHESKVSISKNKMAGVEGLKIIYSKHYNLFVNNCRKKIFSYRLFGLGRELIKEGKFMEGKSYIKKAISIYPFLPQLYFWLVLSKFSKLKISL